MTFNEGAKMATTHELNHTLARRLRQIREESFGEDGIPALADALGIPDRTWSNYESGITLPAHILLVFIQETAANPRWLLTGKGARYTARRSGDRSHRVGQPSALRPRR
jgi:hypothetical protein